MNLNELTNEAITGISDTWLALFKALIKIEEELKTVQQQIRHLGNEKNTIWNCLPEDKLLSENTVLELLEISKSQLEQLKAQDLITELDNGKYKVSELRNIAQFLKHQNL